jgi:hypothetical protein
MWKDDNLSDWAKKFIEEAAKIKPLGGKSTIITARGIYEIDQNYEPPRVTKKEAEDAKN